MKKLLILLLLIACPLIAEDYRYISNRTQWFDADRAVSFIADSGEILYFTRLKHFVLFMPAGTGETTIPEKYSSIRPEVGVTWMQANGFAADITGVMKKMIRGSEH